MTPDEMVAQITTNVRRSLYQRLKKLPLSQTELTGLIATATRTAIQRAEVADLAIMAASGATLAGVVDTLDPEDPALADWRARRETSGTTIRALTQIT